MISTNSSNTFSNFKIKIGQLPIFKTALIILVLVFVDCQGQTFQYSRGWTNGKRGFPVVSGGNTGSNTPAIIEVDNGVPTMEEPPVSPSGTLRLNINGPQGRLRSMDYAQYLSRKLGNGSRKPMWILGDENNSNGEF